MNAKYRLMSPPSLFRTALTAKGEQNGKGFERKFATEWFALFDRNRVRWLSARHDTSITSLSAYKPESS